MLNIRVTYTRPSKDVPFFDASEASPAWLELLESYIAQGKLLSRGRELDPGPTLSLTITSTWRSVADNEQFIAEPLVESIRDARIAHCSEHLIAVVYEREIILDEFDIAT